MSDDLLCTCQNDIAYQPGDRTLQGSDHQEMDLPGEEFDISDNTWRYVGGR